MFNDIPAPHNKGECYRIHIQEFIIINIIIIIIIITIIIIIIMISLSLL